MPFHRPWLDRLRWPLACLAIVLAATVTFAQRFVPSLGSGRRHASPEVRRQVRAGPPDLHDRARRLLLPGPAGVEARLPDRGAQPHADSQRDHRGASAPRRARRARDGRSGADEISRRVHDGSRLLGDERQGSGRVSCVLAPRRVRDLRRFPAAAARWRRVGELRGQHGARPARREVRRSRRVGARSSTASSTSSRSRSSRSGTTSAGPSSAASIRTTIRPSA